MRSLILAIVVCFVAFLPTPAASTIIYESATLGPSVSPGIGFGISPGVGGQWMAVRFELTSSANVESIGGHLVIQTGFGNDLLFIALISLSGALDFPDSSDLSTGDVLGTALLAPSPLASGDVAANLSASLTPGWYAIVVGSGLFGATGIGNMPGNNTPIGSPGYFFKNLATSGNWGPTGVDPDANTRFFLSSTASIPEPATLLLLGSGLVGLSGFSRRRKRH